MDEIRAMTAEPDKKKGGRYTIRDIAAMAGVSRSTVSLALNDSPKIKAKTKLEVLELIDRLGYRPNTAARNLVRRSTRSICVILPQIGHVFSDYYFSESLSGIVEVIARREYHLMVEMASEKFKSERKAMNLFRQNATDGMLCLGNLNTDQYIVDLAQSGCPIVLVNSSLPGVSQVVGDNVTAAFDAVKHLHSLGHTRIGHIRGPESVTTAVDRTAGFLKAVTELGLDYSDDLLAIGYFDESSGYEAMKWLLSGERPPTAVFTTNDNMAIGAMAAIRDAGKSVPEDVAVFGGDDIQLARYVKPRLSTMKQNMYEIGQLACELLFEQLEGNTRRPKIEVPLELVIRESCGAKSDLISK